MMMTTSFSIRTAHILLAAALVTTACGGSNQAFAPSPVPTPAATPEPPPAPEPTPEPTPSTSCYPIPPPVSRVKVKIHLKNRDFWTLDATPLVGPAPHYCRNVGFTDGRQYCTVRPEGDPMRAECEAYAVGLAPDTGRPGPRWTNPDGESCTGPDSLCVNSADNQFMLWIYKGGEFTACAGRDGSESCGSVFADKDL